MWKSLKTSKPKIGQKVITRSPGHKKIGDCLEVWSEWKNEYMNITPHLTHWWNGELNFDLASREWFKEKE